MNECPVEVNCRGKTTSAANIYDVANMSLAFSDGGFATVHSSWLDPKKVRDMAIVGNRKMLVYDDLDPATKVKIYDMRVDPPNTPHESRISYHYGDMWAPYISPDEPLRIEAAHFIECILTETTPITSGTQGLELVCILTAASESMRNNGINILTEDHLPRNGQLIGK
jgi:predicted dehydrogenase